MNVKPFRCQICEDRPFFSRKYTLSRHIASKHGNSTEFFECAQCGLRRSRKDHLRIHIEECHNEQSTKSVFECVLCPAKSNQKGQARGHVMQDLLPQKSDFACSKCPDAFRSFSSQRNLKRHIKLKHANQSSVFECFHCSSIFNQKFHLRRHISSVHAEQKEKTKSSRFRCLKCQNVFCSSKVLNKHYVDVHGVELNYEKFEFDSDQSYKQWLEDHQNETLTRYTIWYRTKKAARLICHRSGDIRTSLTVDSRKRCLKTSGYKRLGGICPAEIRLQIRDDGTHCVKYQKTHVGHNIGDESELGRMFLTEEEKKKIAAEIQSGVPLAQIVNRKRLSRLSDPGENTSRLGLVTRQDVRNIAVSLKLGIKNRKHVQLARDSVDEEETIQEHKDDVAFYKRQGEEDSQFNILRKEDFVLVIISSNQEKYLRNYGHKVVCLDGTHSNNPCGFFLHTLLVLDIDEEGLPAAFLLTNRNDQSVIDVFLTCVRDRVGILQPHTLITDLQTTYYNSWAKMMNNPAYYLFCTWHVHEEWRRNYCKIANKKKRDDVRSALLRLSQELDPIKFENDLNMFLSRDDDELMNFQSYFRQNYGSNAQRWAYCYRTTAGINTNTAIKSFYKSFKYILAGGQKIQSLTQSLVFIFDFLTLLETNLFEKNVRGKVTNKLRMLRIRHREALNQYKEDALSGVLAISTDMYMVQSCEKTDDFHTVLRRESKECERENDTKNKPPTSCRLVCDWCNLCFHAFCCSCEDSSIKSNMCKHIHLVGLYLKDQPLESDANKFKCVKDEVNVPVVDSYSTNNQNSTLIYIEDKILKNIDNIEVHD